MSSIAEALATADIATLRYNFPYSEYGTGRDSADVCISTIRAAVAAAREHAPDLKLLAGGQSFGGRMTSTAQSIEPLKGVKGLVFFGFPLHLADKPATKRAEHLKQISIPMLFITGTRDKLADLDLIKGVVKDLGPLATLHLVDTADHGFHVLKRSRATSEDVFSELGHTVHEWVTKRSL
jgi:predicted alpha/beta-hydrolase family hydrolase